MLLSPVIDLATGNLASRGKAKRNTEYAAGFMLSKVVIVVQRSVPYALKHASAHATVIHGGYSARLSPKHHTYFG